MKRGLQVVLPAADAGVDVRGPAPERKTIGYVRVSSRQEDRQVLSPEAQVQCIRDFCKLHSLGEPEFVRERESAATIRKRPELMRVLALCRAGQVATVVVQDLTRLFRDVREALNTFDEMERRHGVRFLSAVDLQANEQSADGEFLRDLKLILGQRERKVLGERIRRVMHATKHVPPDWERASLAMESKAERGSLLCGNAPFGFRWGPGLQGKRKIILCPHDGLILRRIYELRDQGLGPRRIARIFMLENVRTRKGGRIFRSKIARALAWNWRLDLTGEDSCST